MLSNRSGPNAPHLVLPLLVAAFAIICGVSSGNDSFTPRNLKLVGGYRVGWYNANRNEFVGKSSGFPYGGMAAHTFEDGTLRVWHENGEQGRQVIESSTTLPMGQPGADPSTWPLLDEADSAEKVWSKSELFGDRTTDGFVIPQGLAFDPESNRLWVAARSTYATGPDSQQWLAAVDYPSREVNPVQPVLGLSQQKYGGGLGIIPKAFANEHLAGRRLGFISGGYESGQRASMGPTLAATYLEPGRQSEAVELMYHLTTAGVGSTPFERGRPYVPESFPDYTTDMDWQYPVADGVGYWPGASIRGNGAWLPNGSVLWMNVRGAGDQTYAAQTEGGGAPRKNTLYVYEDAHFAEVAAGNRDAEGAPREVYEYFEWGAENNGGIDALARSMSYDAGAGLLWVYYPQVWRGDVERHPIVAAYEIVTDIAFRPGDFDHNGQVNHLDYDLWRASYGSTVRPGEGADGNQDGVIDVADYAVWRQAFKAKKVTKAVPEPAALLSAVIAQLFFASSRSFR